MLRLIYFLALALTGFASGINLTPWGGDHGSPLFLTPYLERGDLEEGRAAAQVPPLVPGLRSYAGFFSVQPEYQSNMFFWYFPAPRTDAPVVVWLQGGPGSSSMFGLFYENGPLVIDGFNLTTRDESWSSVSNLIFIDNPVGTGFSFTNDSKGYCQDQTCVGNNLYSTILQFFKLFPELQGNDLYITGESYGGKYVPAMAYTIHERNSGNPELFLNLKGVAMGNALSDPVNMLNYSDYLYELGLIDNATKSDFKRQEDVAKSYIAKKMWINATLAFGELILGFGASETMFHRATGFNMYYNFLKTDDDTAQDDIGAFLNQDHIRKSIHVGALPFNDGSEVQMNLMEDIMKSVAPWVATLLDNYRVVVYNGQLDIIVAYPLTMGYLGKVDWCGKEAYHRAKRHVWNVGQEIAGYSKTVKPTGVCKGSLVELLVRNAGHMVPHDQPRWALDLISRVVYQKDF